MSWFGKYIKSSVGTKHTMALSGLMLIGFIFAHMVGNLQLFKGQEAINSYALMLKNLGALLWVARIGLVVLFFVHVSSALRLVSMNRAARPVKYKMVHNDKSTFASRAMPVSGLIVLAFLVFHLVHFTLGGGMMSDNFNLVDSLGRHDVFNMTVLGFQKAPVTAMYVIAMSLLSLHLKHGVTSIFQSLGLNHPKYNGIFKMAGPAVALIVLVGNCSMPIACLAGWIKVAS